MRSNINKSKTLIYILPFCYFKGDESTALLVTDLVNELIISVACGDGQTIALTAEGEVYGWGCYKDKEGKKFFNIPPNTPTKAIKDQRNTPLKIQGLCYLLI